MHVLHLLNYGWPYVDGYTARARSLVSAQRRELGLDTTVAVSPFPPFARATDPELTADGWGPDQVRVRARDATWVPRRARLALGRWERPALGLAPLAAPAFTEGLAAAVQEIAPDVVHAHHPAFVGRAGLAVARRAGVAFVYELRCFNGDYDLDARHPYVRTRGHRQNRLELALCRAADHVVTISAGLAARIVAGGVPEARVSVVRNAVDPALWTPVSSPDLRDPELLRVGYATTFEAIEGLDLLVEAVAQVAPVLARRGRRLEVVLAGTGRDWNRIRGLVDQAGLASTISLPGFITRGQLRQLYAGLDLFVVPRRPAAVATDTTPLKPLEALAAGLPLLATDLPALRELLGGRSGVRHIPAGADGLAAGLLDFAEQPWAPDLPVDLGERTWDREVHHYRAVYEQVGVGVGSGDRAG